MRSMSAIGVLPMVLLGALSLGAAPHGDAGPGPTPAQAYGQLVKGNGRFAGGKAKHGDQTPAVRKGLAAGQKPHSIVVTCSDSRVAPEIAFDQGLGKLFEVREAGNALDPHAIASIEYAAEHLGATLIVVMGHDSCGAVKAAIYTAAGASAGSPSLDVLVKDLKTNLATAPLTAEDTADPTVHKPVMVNVDAVVKQLVASSPLLKAKVDAGALAVVPAVYALDTGKVTFWGDEALKAPAK
jgi:carbonic anhydrase